MTSPASCSVINHFRPASLPYATVSRLKNPPSFIFLLKADTRSSSVRFPTFRANSSSVRRPISVNLPADESHDCATLAKKFIGMLKIAATGPRHIAFRYGNLLARLWSQGHTMPEKLHDRRVSNVTYD
ncbi:uncharacterized protein BO97DRAFT_426751 [Aspergillus homomorphus CBS 101889]|uniref:Uncharacterized protein n=1 Tax=Aspergillus homomorphus (strain CBS 101889) TaxID=1450537 RepID=A0A395HRN0_ASPHC|nr:hypothetical protein BO97DRAFT_426751 [Aspergillus homomorphus CBS 101889]RAL10226.1 hypothetical protein BO97DRAFT_426751 [Aspergillus homomorphus CBS 101889]